jgi:hypothetical protein
MPIAKLLPGVPAPAAHLGLAGILPFAGAAAASFGSAPLGAFATQALLAYGAVILSFLGGLQWGLLIREGRVGYRGLGFGVLPSLVGWAALLLGGRGGLVVLAVSFLLVLVVDTRLARAGIAPDWFPRLRGVLTGAVVLCLLVATAF